MPFKLLLLCLIIPLFSRAQSGNTVSRSSLGFSFEGQPFFSTLTGTQDIKKDGSTYSETPFFLGQHCLFGFALNRRLEFISDFGVRRMKYSYNTVFNPDISRNIYPISGSRSYKALEMGLDIGLRYFFRKFTSPAGLYQQITIGFVKAIANQKNPEIELQWYSDLSDSYLTTTLKPYEGEMSIIRLSYGVGTKKMISQNFFFDTDFKIHFTLNPPNENYNTLFRNNFAHISPNEYTKEDFIINFGSYKRYTLRIGFGLIV